MFILHEVVPWEIRVDVAIAEVKQRFRILLVPIYMQSCVLRLRKVFRMKLWPSAWVILLRELEVILAYSLVLVVLSIRVLFICLNLTP